MNDVVNKAVEILVAEGWTSDEAKLHCEAVFRSGLQIKQVARRAAMHKAGEPIPEKKSSKRPKTEKASAASGEPEIELPKGEGSAAAIAAAAAGSIGRDPAKSAEDTDAELAAADAAEKAEADPDAPTASDIKIKATKALTSAFGRLVYRKGPAPEGRPGYTIDIWHRGKKLPFHLYVNEEAGYLNVVGHKDDGSFKTQPSRLLSSQEPKIIDDVKGLGLFAD